jgi:hypothetical protein
MQPHGLNCQGIEGQGAKKEICFVHKILGFHFLHILFLLMILHDGIFNVTTWM